jgi:molybdenum cofactor sulfurtransferase
MAYLDHAGATLYSEAQMADVLKDLASNVYGNPHSQSDSSMAASDLVTAARHQVLCASFPEQLLRENSEFRLPHGNSI